MSGEVREVGERDVGFALPAYAPGPGEPTHRVVLEHPVVDGHTVTFRWTVDPATELYRHDSFRMRFPDTVPIAGVPEGLWWTVALLCLHTHWALLRPCRVELPVTLGPGEAETWMRLVDALVTSLDLTTAAHAGTLDDVRLRRVVEIVELGPALPEPRPTVDAGRTATAFSGGKDSLVQLGLLAELGRRPVAVTTTSPMPPMHDHLTARRRHVLATVPERLPIDLVEVDSDLRAAWDNGFASPVGWQVAVNELADTHLYLASTLVVAQALGAPLVLLASEAELQETVELGGHVVQHPHLMYSAATQQAVSALLGRWGMAHGSLTYPLQSGHVQHLLWSRYPQLRDLQYSCWRVGAHQATCSGCSQCLRTALTAITTGADPIEMGIDLVALLPAMRDWSPSAPSGLGLPDDAVRAGLHGQVVRDLRAVGTATMARLLFAGATRRPRRLLRPARWQALAAHRSLRRRVTRGVAVAPDPGYRRSSLALVHESLREPLAAIFDASFPAAEPARHEASLDRTRRLVAWTTAPLRGAAPGADPGPTLVGASTAQGATRPTGPA
jgi:hypothetical protein